MSNVQQTCATHVALTPDQLHLLRHALGIGEAGTGREYRNYFVTGAGGTDHRVCSSLVAAGMMFRHAGSVLTGGSDVFTVTPSGRAAAVAVAPPVRPGQRRYQAYLQSDSPLPFIDWLRAQNRSSANGR
ncbi:hypothetical protein N7359_01830 [Stenotrophomonas maltophilia]|uniref:hypothetical protein n=1 Tax=Stenotrophomonas maltophilia TaxID=40324 RepID=UPI00244B60F6|nr:hypothetical protein [Stenotrophomonas maltophilia]MDH0071281.1 hypothetical protein [Stenotrophomonas maltophilia]MDH0104122.1 hypothetical protein [Stenotrophomonas maltophilia]MDH0330229.1 hypothetical protein [Stenotrophomonas maltophilia]